MKPPAFWYQDVGLRAALLSPLAAIYDQATARRVRKSPDFVANVPVICIGNINAGGTGKTPTTIALATRLTDAGQAPHIVSCGYGGAMAGPVRVDANKHTAADVGDEPLLLSAFAPTWVAKNRAVGVRAAQDAGATVILLDDGFQNPSIRKDLQLVVVDAVKGFGNGRVMPAGPLRETAAAGLVRADALMVIGPDHAREKFTPDLPATCARLDGRLDALPTGMPWGGLPVLAFAGIGHPEKFFATVKGLGANLVRAEPLGDHQPFTDTLLKRLETEAKTRGLHLVTTEKDAARMPAHFRSKVMVVPVRLTVIDWSPIDQKLNALGLSLQE